MKTKLLLPVLFFSVVNVSAQQSYFTAGVGYGFFLPPVTGGQQLPYTYNNEGATLGRGMNYGFNIGYMATEHAGLDLGIWYSAGSTYERSSVDSANHAVPGRFRGNTLRIVPAIKLMWGEKHKPYIKLGALLGIATDALIENEYNINNTCVISPYIITHKFSGGTSSGWFGTVGINFSADEKTSFFFEANVYRQQYEPVKETVEACGAPTRTFDLVDNPNPANPNEKAKPSFPFSSIGINAGVKILLGMKNKNPPTLPNYPN